MSVRTTKTTSWFDRIRSSVAGIGSGIMLVIAMVGLLFWNEGSAVQTQRSLDEGAGQVISVATTPVDPANEGKLVHLSGPVVANDSVIDAAFGVTANGLRLIRKIEMYQWLESSRTEKKQNLGGSETQVTTYSYKQDWAERSQDSSRFQEPAGHQNPAMVYQSSSITVSSAELGAFRLDNAVIGRVDGAKPFPLQQAQAASIRDAAGIRGNVSVVDGAAYIAMNPAQPRIGDYRIRYELVPLDTISVVAQQRGNGFSAYQTQAGDSLLMVHNGQVDAQAMFDDAASDNAIMTWIFRVVGLLLMIGGFSLMLHPLSVLASVIPFAGSIVSLGTGLVAMAAGITLGTLTIASAWLFYRPLVALIIFALGAASVFLLRRVMRRRQAATEPLPAQ